MSDPRDDTSQDKTTAAPSRNTTNWWIALAVALGVAAILVLLRVGYVNHWVVTDSYSPAQLAAAGGWVSGLGSVIAVSVALTQTWFARRDVAATRASADKARNDAEERHTRQLAQSESLLVQQLDAQRRAQQIAILADVLSPITDVELAVTDLDTSMAEYSMRTIDQDQLIRTWRSFEAARRRAFDALNRAQLVVEIAEVLNKVNSIADALGRLSAEAEHDFHRVHRGESREYVEQLKQTRERLPEEIGGITVVIRRYLGSGAQKRGMSIFESPRGDEKTSG